MGKKLINSLNREKISEIASYKIPTPVIEEVVKSTLYLLGETKSTVKDWKKMRAKIAATGKNGIQYRISNFKSTDVKIEAAVYVRKVLGKRTLEDVEENSKTLGILYAWTKLNADFVLQNQAEVHRL